MELTTFYPPKFRVLTYKDEDARKKPHVVRGEAVTGCTRSGVIVYNTDTNTKTLIPWWRVISLSTDRNDILLGGA